MPHNLTFAQTATFLQRFPVTFDPVIQKVYTSLVDDSYAMLQPLAVDHSYVKRTARSTEIMAPYSTEWNVKFRGYMDEHVVSMRKISAKFEVTQEELDGYFDTFYNEWSALETANSTVYDFATWLYNELIMPQWAEDRFNLIWNGVYQAPVSGAAGLAINAADGLHIQLKRAIARGAVTPQVTGLPTEATIVDQLKQFTGTLPSHLQSKRMPIYMSPEDHRMYRFAWQEKYGKNTLLTVTGQDPNLNAELNKFIVPLNFMTGSHRWFACTEPKPLIELSKRDAPNARMMPKFDFGTTNYGYTLYGKSDPWFGCGYKAFTVENGVFNKQVVFANEQN
jgi:hypothetical protein